MIDIERVRSELGEPIESIGTSIHRFHHDRSQPSGRRWLCTPAPSLAPKNKPPGKAAMGALGIPSRARALCFHRPAKSVRPGLAAGCHSRLGLGRSEAIQKACDLACDLRWPNDVLIQSKKCAGILTQLEGQAIVAGIGINVNHSAFPDELNAIATSLTNRERPPAFARKASGGTDWQRRQFLRAARKRGQGTDPCDVCPCIQLCARTSRVRGSRRLECSRHHSRPQRRGLFDAAGMTTETERDHRRRSPPMLLALDAGNSNITIGAFEGANSHRPLAAAHHP